MMNITPICIEKMIVIIMSTTKKEGKRADDGKFLTTCIKFFVLFQVVSGN